ncbi:E3 ubiquitin-protein ligase TRAIP-like [Symsagittifera roscoffensis]|uniref:E3 ubiquitin-protein ligase TRAIP-like n=1 Tax=Symsagittifera roscoffensis TaxID=84072 RepID=UPI00307CAC62
MPVIPITCPVCLSTIVPDDNLSNPGCGHVFHTSCIEEWFRVHKCRTCPHCRKTSRLAQSHAIYLQFDENALNETLPRVYCHSDEVELVPKTSAELEKDNDRLKRELTKVKSELSSYSTKMEQEKTSREQTISYLSNQVTNMESNLSEKNEQCASLTRKVSSINDSLVQARNDVNRKVFKIQDLERQLHSAKSRFEAEVERPCLIRSLLNAKSSEIRAKVENYKQMGDHGIQVLSEFAVAADSEARRLKNELRNLRVEVEMLKENSESSRRSNIELTSRDFPTSKLSSLKRQFSGTSTYNLDETLDHSADLRSKDLKRSANENAHSRLSDILSSADEGKENSFIEEIANEQSVRSSSGSKNSSQDLKAGTSKAGAVKKKAFVPVHSDDDDILMEQTIMIESPEFRNPLSKVKGSLLNRNSSKPNSKGIKRSYNGLGFSSAPLFQRSNSFRK